MVICIILTCILFTLFLIFKPLRTHPGELLVLTAFFQVSWLFAIVVQKTTCYNIEVPIFETFGTIFIGSDSTKEAIHLRIQDIMANGALFYEMIVCLDLALAIYMPLYAPQRRNKFYHLAFIIELGILIPIDNSCNPFPQWLETSNNIPAYDRIVNQISNISYLIISLISIIYFGIKILKNMKAENKAKSLVYRYFIYGIMFSICDLIIIISEISYISESVSQLAFEIGLIYMPIEIIVVCVLRITEPYTFKYLKQKLSYFCTSTKFILKRRLLRRKIIMNKQEILNQSTSIFLLLQTNLSAKLFKYMLKGIISSLHISIHENYKMNESDSLNFGYLEDYDQIQGKIPNEDQNKRKAEKYIFTEIEAEIFKRIRDISSIYNSIILYSLDPVLNKKKLLSVGEGSGKSGCFFFFSHDEQFIIKIIQNDEKKTLVNMLRNYEKYLNFNSCSLLSKIYSLFSLKVPGMAKIHAVLMANTFYNSGIPRNLEYIFDLKGSIVHRFTQIIPGKMQTLKDLNFLRINKKEKFMKYSDFDENKFQKAISQDADFLYKQGIMDYSLLLGVENNSICAFEIIDYFQKYNYIKKMERFLKVLYNPSRKNRISCMNPKQYYKRFVRFIISITAQITSVRNLNLDQIYLL